MNSFENWLRNWGTFLVGFIIILSSTFFLASWATKTDCKMYGETTGKNTKVVFGACYIEAETGKWEHWREHFYRSKP